jgi:hypothetical protein
MKICSSCFSDKEIIGFISSRSVAVGQCDFCGSTDVDIIDISELYDFFNGLINNFQLSPKGDPFIKLIQHHWNLFKNEDIGASVFNYINRQLDTTLHDASDLVGFSPEILEVVNYWDKLKKMLKCEKRYVHNINYLTEDLGWDALLSRKISISNKTKFYRARLHQSESLTAYSTDEMYGPQQLNATAGRANPAGIPFLYLCDNKETVLYEIRASYLDEISIGSFGINTSICNEIDIADFTENPSIFCQGENVNDVANIIKEKLLKDLISSDLSKPMRRYDSEIDYIPTQFICEFIKNFSGVHGVKFRSSLHAEGNNIVIFDQNVMICEFVEKVKVSQVFIHAQNL